MLPLPAGPPHRLYGSALSARGGHALASQAALPSGLPGCGNTVVTPHCRAQECAMGLEVALVAELRLLAATAGRPGRWPGHPSRWCAARHEVALVVSSLSRGRAPRLVMVPAAGGSSLLSPSPLGLKLFMLAHASISVPSALKCSSDRSALLGGWLSTAPKNFTALSPSSSRSWFPPLRPCRPEDRLRPRHRGPDLGHDPC